MTTSGNGFMLPSGVQRELRLQQIEECHDLTRLNELLRKSDWVLVNMYPNSHRLVDETAVVYVMGKIGR